MTIRERLEQLCRENGLWPDEAREVLERQIAEPNSPMQHRWEDDVEGYPPQLLAVLWLNTRRIAVAYIDEKKPKHFARPMFLDAALDTQKGPPA